MWIVTPPHGPYAWVFRSLPTQGSAAAPLQPPPALLSTHRTELRAGRKPVKKLRLFGAFPPARTDAVAFSAI